MYDEISKALSSKAANDLDYVELRAQDLSQTTVRIRMSDVEMLCRKQVFGHSARVLKEGVWGFSYSDGSTDVQKTIRNAANAASSFTVRRPEECVTLASIRPVKRRLPVKAKLPLSGVDVEAKISYLKGVCASVRMNERRAKTCWADYSDTSGNSTLVTSDGTVVESEVSELNMMITASGVAGAAKASAREEMGIVSVGWEHLDEAYPADAVGERVSSKLKDHLEGTRCRRGSFKCVLGPRVVGMLAHEALGHLSEADLFYTGAFEGLEGKRVAPDGVTMIDSPQMRGGFGNIDVDDEGVIPRKVVLIDKGFLGDRMTNRQWAARLGTRPTGNARAESYRKPPIIRMRNTYFSSGDMDINELLESVGHGYYCGDVRGGQAESNSSFQIGIQQCYEIEKGELGRPVRDLSISGIAVKSLRLIDGVGKDFGFESSYCGKYDQSMATSDGGPHVSLRKGAVVFGGA